MKILPGICYVERKITKYIKNKVNIKKKTALLK
jgi:hypothetical protein